MSGVDSTALASVYTDFRGTAKLKASAAADGRAARRETAEQFEALFLQTMLKEMRKAGHGDALFGSDQLELYQDMLDKQLAISLSGSGGIGLADIIERQLGPAAAPAAVPSAVPVTAPATAPVAAPTLTSASAATSAAASATGSDSATSHAAPRARSLEFAGVLWSGRASASSADTGTKPHRQAADGPRAFLASMADAAERAAQRLGTSREVVLAVAALESGWGRHMANDASGRSSNNLFGIKADRRWQGDAVVASTQEYIDGQSGRFDEAFRRYDSAAESVEDFATFLLENPRYTTALEHAADSERFLVELQRAGYATDPNYARKLLGVLDTVHRHLGSSNENESMTQADTGDASFMHEANDG